MNKLLALWASVGLFSTAVFAMTREAKVTDRLDASEDTIIDMMHASDHGIPHHLLARARCVVIVPGMKKAGFIFGAKYGRGFVACRNPEGWWFTARGTGHSGRKPFVMSDPAPPQWASPILAPAPNPTAALISA